ncbi:hypothetical protein L195_g000724 [Trifolium pratense]|uniref:Uncharacterized protein n=1 Tax=Trifolium pratense TaxID=57577 RepID=A0A2K3NMP7_TRIPR|nr:hypothetical protein L195_g000724 [Trifolium pratense]
MADHLYWVCFRYAHGTINNAPFILVREGIDIGASLQPGNNIGFSSPVHHDQYWNRVSNYVTPVLSKSDHAMANCSASF